MRTYRLLARHVRVLEIDSSATFIISNPSNRISLDKFDYFRLSDLYWISDYPKEI